LSSPRWRVILVRLPSGRPGSPHGITGARFLPQVLLESTDHAEAVEHARRVRAEGAEVVVVEHASEGHALCPAHPAEVAARDCRDCGAPICAECRADARGERICGRCLGKRWGTARMRRVRQLFAVFVFVVFAYQVLVFVRGEEDLLDSRSTIRGVIVQFAESSLLDDPFVLSLSQGEPGERLSAIGPWFDAERQRYTGLPGRALDLDLVGPFPAAEETPDLGEPGDGFLALAYKAWAYPRFYHERARRFGVDPDRYAVRVYVTYVDTALDVESESRGSRRGRVAAAELGVKGGTPAYAQLTVAHEIGHILGAADHYDPDTFLAVYPEGYVEPLATPRYPQRYAELMAVDVPQSERTEREVESLDEVRVGSHTAAELGWIGGVRAAGLKGGP
jgi:hypothetical protein